MHELREMVNALQQQNYIDVAKSFRNFQYIEGKAKFVSAHEIEVNGQVYRAQNFLIATGSRPRIIPFKGIDKVDVLTNRQLFNLDELPKTLAVIGAGPIGIEMAQAFAHFGSKVVVIEREPQLLPQVDQEIAEELQKALETEGIEFFLAANIVELRQETTHKTVKVEHNGSTYEISADQILMATGVIPNTDGLDLDKIGVETDARGFVKTNKFLQSTQPHIYAAGDVAGNDFLETIAAKEGYIAATNIFEGNSQWINYDHVPHAVFTSPQVATVGFSEKKYLKTHESCECRILDLKTIPKALALKEQTGVIKMMIDPETEKIVGVSIVSNMAADLIHEATIAVKFGLTLNDIIDTVHVFPTMSEGLKRVAQAFKINVHAMTCCVV